jgi:hypothetical protein
MGARSWRCPDIIVEYCSSPPQHLCGIFVHGIRKSQLGILMLSEYKEINCCSDKGIEMPSQKHLAALKLFNEKADKLKRCSFTRFVYEQDAGVYMSAKKDENIVIERTGPSEEAIDAFALTFRFVIQDNEKSSFRNLGKIYDELPDSNLQKESFANARRDLNYYLDAFSMFNVNNVRLSNRHILEVFMYGGLSHANVIFQLHSPVPFSGSFPRCSTLS